MYKFLPIFLLVAVNFSFSYEVPKYYEPEYYSIIFIRNYTINEDIPFSFWNEHIDLDWYDDLSNVVPKNTTWAFTFGYRKPFNNFNYKLNYVPFHNYFFGLEFEGLNYYDGDYTESMTWMNWSIGYGMGIKTSKNYQINLSVQYNFFSGVDYYDWGDAFNLEANDYLSFNIGVGFNTYGKSKWSQFGMHFNKPINKHYINSALPNIEATEIGFEINPIISGAGLLIAGLVWALAESGDDGYDSSSPSTSSSSSSKGCHVYGKIKIVDFGEDYKVKAVDFGENLKVKYVSFGEGSVGKWKIVDFGEDYKVKFVDFGEDIKVKFVDFGEGCK